MPETEKNFKKENPIGIFDSGIGGLTVASELCKRLPNEQIIYFGDTAHLPYGDKSTEAIRSYSVEITRFLLSMNCKMVLIACNSASVSGYQAVTRIIPRRPFALNVIDPVVEHIVRNRKFKKIGLIGTKRTVESKVYSRKLRRLNPDIKLQSLATPLLAPMIEEGYFNNNISQTIINSYLSKPHLKGIEALILGCTHYPLIEKEVDNYFRGKVEIINSAKLVAEAVEQFLVSQDLLAPKSRKKPEHRFFVSDFTPSFQKSAAVFFGKGIDLKKKNLWG